MPLRVSFVSADPVVTDAVKAWVKAWNDNSHGWQIKLCHDTQRYFEVRQAITSWCWEKVDGWKVMTLLLTCGHQQYCGACRNPEKLPKTVVCWECSHRKSDQEEQDRQAALAIMEGRETSWQ